MYRVVNLDMSCYCKSGEKDIIFKCDTLEEAKKCEIENYYFNTSVEQLVNGEWHEVLLNGLTEQEWKEIRDINKS